MEGNNANFFNLVCLKTVKDAKNDLGGRGML